MRLFAALLPPEDVRAELALAVAELRGLPGAAGLRWTGPPGWHLTLAFYGEVGDDAVADLSERLAGAARHTGPFRLALRGGGQFGHGRVLWAGADGDLAALRLLADRAAAAGREAGLPMADHHAYRPHLTVARGREATDLDPYLTALEGYAGRPWTVHELALVRSNLPEPGQVGQPTQPGEPGESGEPPRYETVAREPLGAAG
ncbi:RNA 2',3'-cyclic phosphodiesterase [Streptomyces sp. NPDC005423]|uniref:RNA 2',3'-cyclic phosphodiesterase n=1 Tax=Streptomyces sp. NPDC005423 TaxID=3155343 RepID=UPI00339F3FC5